MTAPPMLDEQTLNLGQQTNSVFIVGKKILEENIMKSITEGPFQMGTFIQTPAEDAEETEGALQLGPERARVFTDLSAEEKERYKADIRATNILLQGIPKDIYTLINHYTDAKDIWDNVKMILEGSELTKDDREFPPQLYAMNLGLKESNFDQLYAYLKQHEVHANENRMMMERFIQPTDDPLALVSNASNQKYPTQSSESPQSSNLIPSHVDKLSIEVLLNARNKATVQDDRVVVQDVRDRYNVNNQRRPFHRNNARGKCCSWGMWRNRHIAQECPQLKSVSDSDYFKDKMLLMNAHENGAVLKQDQSVQSCTPVNDSTEASGSKPRSNTKKNRIPPAQTENKKKVEVHPRTNNLEQTKQDWKEQRGKLLVMLVNQWRSYRKKVALGKLNCGYQWRPTGKKFALGELCPLTKLSVQCGTDHPSVSGLKLFKTRFRGRNEWLLSSLGLHCQKTFDQISSNLVSQMSQRRLLASLQAPFLKEKKGVRFSALYLQQKRNLLVLDHSHQQVSYFFHARSVVKWINVDQLKLQKKSYIRIFQLISSVTQTLLGLSQWTYYVYPTLFPPTSANVPSIYIQLFWNTLTHDVKTGVYSFQVNEHWLTLSVDLLRKALNVTPADSAHPFESPPAGTQMSLEVSQAYGQAHVNRVAIPSQDETTGPSVHPEDATSTKMVRETLSHEDAEFGGNLEKINSETDTKILNVGSNSKQSHVALAGPNPEHMQDVFLATSYPKGGASSGPEPFMMTPG
ncbi:hypothetical protein Tco_1254289 [Tanacetum coccineum]